ncbi:hypothetical protein UlMin_028718 [Ulmus minor]
MNLRQDQNSVSIYFTKLKTIWEELSNYRPNCSCGKFSCGGVKHLNEHHQMEHIMSFLMGLDDSFSQVHGQLLLMDPMPPINRVFSLIVQEEQQRKTNPSSDSNKSTGTMAFAVKTEAVKTSGSNSQRFQNSNFNASKNQKRDRPYCTHCKILGHTMDRCYKIHGYPPGYKFKINNNSNAAAHQVSASDDRLDQSSPFGSFDLSTKKMIGRVDKVQDLYILNLNSISHAFVNNVSAHIWHNRLGHISFKRLDSLKDQLKCDVTRLHKSDPCYICPLAKQRRLPFESNNHLSKFPFDLVHCDIWGPYQTISYTGHRYFLTLVDDCTRFTLVYLLKNKSDAISVIPKFFNMIFNQFHANIKVFRSDNAPELSFVDFFQDKGVLHQFSCVERPQQNSVVESKHQHLLNVARSLFFQSRIHISF